MSMNASLIMMYQKTAAKCRNRKQKKEKRLLGSEGIKQIYASTRTFLASARVQG